MKPGEKNRSDPSKVLTVDEMHRALDALMLTRDAGSPDDTSNIFTGAGAQNAGPDHRQPALEVAPDPRRERGESLVEVLLALAILLFIMVSVLQLFTMAILTYHATNAQAEMTGKAESVVEVIRLVRSTGATAASGILPLAAGTRRLPSQSGDTGFSFWGPSGFGVVEHDPPYRVSYEIDDLGTEWLVTVFVEPNQGEGRFYLAGKDRKGVRYAARLPK